MEDEYENGVSSTTNGHDTALTVTQLDGPCDELLPEENSAPFTDWGEREPGHKRGAEQEEPATYAENKGCQDSQDSITQRWKISRSSF